VAKIENNNKKKVLPTTDIFKGTFSTLNLRPTNPAVITDLRAAN
jgi:hypothetical protein